MPGVEESLDSQIRRKIADSEFLMRIYEYLSGNEGIKSLLEMANIVMVVRYGYNDHGPVHAKITTLNALKIVDILKDSSIIRDKIGDLIDTKAVLMISAYLHDLGNAVNRDEHEILSIILAKPYVEELLGILYRDKAKRVKLEAAIYDCIYSHMGNHGASSIEAGIVATADGCDMEKGRARIPYRIGGLDIHKFSALSIERVNIVQGGKKPVRIEVHMKDTTGIFQVEELLIKRKLEGTNFRRFVEIVAIVDDKKYYY